MLDGVTFCFTSVELSGPFVVAVVVVNVATVRYALYQVKMKRKYVLREFHEEVYYDVKMCNTT